MEEKKDKQDMTKSEVPRQQQQSNHSDVSKATDTLNEVPVIKVKTNLTENINSPCSSNSPIESVNNSTNKQSRSKKFKKIACTECRQQKAKCDAHEKNPNPCTRCTKRNIPCRLDSDFKRTFKRAKIDELVKEYEIIKSKLQINPDLINTKDLKNINEKSLILQFNNNNSHNNNNNNDNNKNKSNRTNTDPNSNTTSNFTLNKNSQFLPPLQSLQRVSNFLNSGYKSTGNSPLPNPNIFHSSSPSNNIINNITSPINNISTTSLGRSLSPLPVSNRPQYSPLPSNTRNNSLSNSNNTNNNNNNNNSTNTLLSSLPKYDNLNTNNRVSSNYNLTTLISAANASNRHNTENNPENISEVNSSNLNNGTTNLLNWKNQVHSVVKPIIDPSTLVCTSKTLGDVTLNENQIVILYSTFVTHYHPLLPIIDLNKGIERIYRLCPVLFWTIMLISLRGNHELSPILSPSDCQSLYFTLSPILKSVLAEISISPITRYAPTEVDEPILNASSVYSVQAFLIYTFWPPLTSSLSADSSWNTVGIAVYQAIRIGLHSPGHTSDRLKSTNNEFISEQIRTWVGCNIVSQTIGTVFGFPGFFQPYTSLLLTGIEIPKSLKQMLEIQTFEEQVEKTLNNNAFDPLRLNHASERLPMILLLENELNQLEVRLCSDLKNPLDDFRAFSLYASRLHLLCYYFQDAEQVPSFELRRGYIKTYNASLAVIKHCKDSQDRDNTFICNLPSAYILTIWQASVIIARLVHSNYKDILDETAGKELYQIAIGLALKASVIKHDLSYRSCGIMKSTWNLFKSLDDSDELKDIKVNVKSRMSASIFFDTLWILREKCGMIKLRPTKEKNNSESVESDSDIEEIDEGSNENNKTINKNTMDLLNNEKESRAQSKDSTVSSKKKSYNVESSTRRIISTIPLDPVPIGIAETPQDSNSNSSKQSSPYLSNYKSPTNGESSIKKIITPQSLANVTTSQYHESPNISKIKNADNNDSNLTTTQNKNILNMNKEINNLQENSDDNRKAASSFLVDSWDIGNEFDSAMLFKDIESVMDEFGFHADY